MWFICIEDDLHEMLNPIILEKHIFSNTLGIAL